MIKLLKIYALDSALGHFKIVLDSALASSARDSTLDNSVLNDALVNEVST